MLRSFSQSGQDRFVIDTLLPGKVGGFFIEAGAGDGLYISNTLLLERDYGWTGLLIEPTGAYERLRANRPNCACDSACLADVRKTVIMVDILDRGQAGLSDAAADNLLLSRCLDAPVDEHSNAALAWASWGEMKRQYPKQAEPLADVMCRHDTPYHIDYLSLDVEGSEFDILRAFPFERYTFGCLSIERASVDLMKLLASRGYQSIGVIGEDQFFVPA